ncbi:MAG: hypothetical protein HOO96_14375 [Polyangiaceae bacterium]|nr:hypothetical protein [Polyangiaceae bacterium]
MNDEPPTPEHSTVRGLRREEQEEPASVVLSRVAWNGRVLDPDQLTAVELLGALP